MDTVPIFPEFRRIEMADKQWYEDFYKQFEAYADFSFQNFIVWMDQIDDFELCKLHDNLVFRYSENFSLTPRENQVYTLLGSNDIPKSVAAIFDYQAQHGIKRKLEMVPQVVADAIANSAHHDEFEVTEDRDNAEYVLDANLIANLEGKTMRSLREDCNAFRRANGDDTTVVQLDLTSHEAVVQLVNNLHTWDEVYAHTNNDADRHEAIAINRILQYAGPLEYKNLSIVIKGKMEGFILYRYLPQAGWVLPNTFKMSYAYQDLYDFMVFSFASEVVKHDVAFINFEQDLGVPGLRQYKTSLKPIRFLNKYTVIPAKNL